MNEKRTNEKLYSFVRTGDVEDVLKLIEDGVDINCKDEYGNDALFYAVVHYRLDVIKLLIEKGANCEIVYNDKKNILHIAVESDCEEKGFFEIIPILFNKKTNIDEQDKYGNTPLSYACVYYVVN